MNKEDFLKDFKQEKLNKNTKEKPKINFSNPFKKKNKEKKNKKKRVWLKIVTNIFMLVIILACSFNMIADKDYLNKLDELQKLSEKANGVVNFTPDYLFIQFFAKHSNTIMLFSLIVLVVMIILAFILNMTTFKKGKGE